MGVAGYIQQEPESATDRATGQCAELARLAGSRQPGRRRAARRSLPDADGLDLVSDLRDLGIKVIMLTIADSDEEISRSHFLRRRRLRHQVQRPDQVLAAIRSVCDGQSSFRSTSCRRWRAANSTTARCPP